MRIAVTIVVTIVALAIMPVLSPFLWAGEGNPNTRVIPRSAYPFGKSFNDWSAEWWKWQLSLPATDHPAFSVDGANCDAGQSGKVWFLTGAFTDEFPENEFNTVIRESCSVPPGKAIFFPIINVECSTIESPPFLLIKEGPDKNVDTCAASFVEGPIAVAEDLSVTIDGTALENPEAFRYQSPVFDFSFEDENDNILGVDCSIADCDDAYSISDGYWIMLTPLPVGEHAINFTGSFRDPISLDLIFGLDVTYIITVSPRNVHDDD